MDSANDTKPTQKAEELRQIFADYQKEYQLILEQKQKALDILRHESGK